MGAPDVSVDMLVRTTPAEAWEAFADPDRIRRFWLGSSSGRLETGARVDWVFKVAGAETTVEVVAAEPGRLLDLRWDGGQPLRIDVTDHELGAVVAIRVTGYTDPEVSVESMSGFTLVLASLKLFLEHGIEGELMYDKFPDADHSDR